MSQTGVIIKYSQCKLVISDQDNRQGHGAMDTQCHMHMGGRSRAQIVLSSNSELAPAFECSVQVSLNYCLYPFV